MQNIGFIGAGNMATSIIGGLISQGTNPGDIIASDVNADVLKHLSQQFSIATSNSNQELCAHAEVIVLAVKPQVMKTLCESLQNKLSHKPLIVSIAAGITTSQLNQWLGGNSLGGLAIVRSMPNTPALVQLGATGLFANADVSESQRQSAQALVDAVGTSVWLDDEAKLDAVTAVSGSGPAYFFLLMEAMIKAGCDMGLSPAQARELTLQTALGAAHLAQTEECDVSTLRQRVTSPGGTTEQALLHFEKQHFREIVNEAMQACEQHSKKMSKALS